VNSRISTGGTNYGKVRIKRETCLITPMTKILKNKTITENVFHSKNVENEFNEKT